MDAIVTILEYLGMDCSKNNIESCPLGRSRAPYFTSLAVFFSLIFQIAIGFSLKHAFEYKNLKSQNDLRKLPLNDEYPNLHQQLLLNDHLERN